jgi:hypothetical protein
MQPLRTRWVAGFQTSAHIRRGVLQAHPIQGAASTAITRPWAVSEWYSPMKA